MAMNASQLESEIITALDNCGWDTSNQYSAVQCLAEAVSKAVVNHIQANAEAIVSGGSSSGSWPIE